MANGVIEEDITIRIPNLHITLTKLEVFLLNHTNVLEQLDKLILTCIGLVVDCSMADVTEEKRFSIKHYKGTLVDKLFELSGYKHVELEFVADKILTTLDSTVDDVSRNISKQLYTIYKPPFVVWSVELLNVFVIQGASSGTILHLRIRKTLEEE